MRTVSTSLAIPENLARLYAAGLVSREALTSARLVMETFAVSAKDNPWVCLALAIVMENPSTGNSCIRLADLATWNQRTEVRIENWLDTEEKWSDVLQLHPELIATSAGSLTSPFVLDGDSLYSHKSLIEESYVAQRLSLMLVDGKLQVITGGPGSGKTTSIAKLLIKLLLEDGHADDSVALAAPTGLAAKRMKFALENALNTPELSASISPEMRARILDLPKSTVHKLLSYNPSSRRQFRKNDKDQLDFNVVIVDEVSMMPLSMMARLLEAIPATTTLILVGDKNQLASVESGSVLADICKASEGGASFVRVMPGKYRFAAGSPVAQLSDAINRGALQDLDAALTFNYVAGASDDGKPLPHFRWVDPVDNEAGLNEVAQVVVRHARRICDAAATATTDAELEQLLKIRGELQLICAHRRGKFGVSGWNSTVDRKLGARAKGQWYVGRPIMVSENDYVNELFNGDIGVICQDSNNQRFAAFAGENRIQGFQ